MMWPPQGAIVHDQVVDGWHQEQNEDRDDDVVKIWYEAVHEDGRRVTLDWSPYQDMSDEQFERLVHLGFPSRSVVQSIGPLNAEEVERLWGEAVGRIVEK